MPATTLAARLLVATAALLLSSTGCSHNANSQSNATGTPESTTAAATPTPRPAGPTIKIVTTAGTIVVVLEKARAPKTVANFMHYVDSGFYSGGTFFRAVPGFVIQGGNKARERPSDPRVALEAPVATGLQNTDGAISMARTSDPNSGTSEFFICDGDQPNLDGSMSSPGYAAFGHVISGMAVVRKISHQAADNEMLVNPVKIVAISRA